jgi:2-methylisocitrate lyase-like PEP mutase family enzyme
MSVRSDLKNRLKSGQTIVAPGAYDPISARVVQSLGFDTIYTGGYERRTSSRHRAIDDPD